MSNLHTHSHFEKWTSINNNNNDNDNNSNNNSNNGNNNQRSQENNLAVIVHGVSAVMVHAKVCNTANGDLCAQSRYQHLIY